MASIALFLTVARLATTVCFLIGEQAQAST
jgi:hypothetical protein